MIAIRGLDHIVLRALDPERLLRFYVDVLGCTIERRQDAIGLVQLRAGASLIDLVPGGGSPRQSPAREARNLDHFCLRVETFDEAAIRAHLARHGIAAGQAASRYGAEGEGPSIYLDDPEGNTIELKGPPAAPPAPR